MPWEIVDELGPFTRPHTDASGWVWEIRDGAETRRMLVEVSGVAQAIDDHLLPPETAEVIRTEGRSEVEKVLGADDPPQIVQCGLEGCAPVDAELD